MHGLLLFIHIVVSFFLIIIVLLQSGKSADLAGAFGGMGSQSTFGPRGTASLLSKMTTTLAILFMVTSLLLYISAANKGGGQSSVVGNEKPKLEDKIDDKKEVKKEKTPSQSPVQEKTTQPEKTDQDKAKDSSAPVQKIPDSNKK